MPLVDFGPFLKDEGAVVGEAPTEAQLAVARQIDAAYRQYGFLALTNIGVPADLLAQAFAEAKNLFALPAATKMEEMARVSPETNRGYEVLNALTVQGSKRHPDMKEGFKVRSHHVYENDLRGTPPGFQKVTPLMWDVVERAGRRFMVGAALALGVERDFFLKAMAQSRSLTHRYLHYPPCELAGTSGGARGRPGDDVRSSLRTGEHTDFGVFTMLFLGEGRGQGLQLKPFEGGEAIRGASLNDGWVDAVLPAAANAEIGAATSHDREPNDAAGPVRVVVNLGSFLARWTNDRWRATGHRVVVPDEEEAKLARYSLACFFDPDPDWTIGVDPRFLAVGEAPKYEPLNYKEFALMKLREGQMAKEAESAALLLEKQD